MKIVHEASQYQNHLKNRPVGKKPIKLSHWENYLQLPKTQIESIAEEETKQKILAILDKIYQEHKRIPNYYSLFLSMPELLIHLYEFEEKIIFDSVSEKTCLSLVHKYYLGVIVIIFCYVCRQRLPMAQGICGILWSLNSSSTEAIPNGLKLGLMSSHSQSKSSVRPVIRWPINLTSTSFKISASNWEKF